LLFLSLIPVCLHAQGNTIGKRQFNFGHQLGYLYSRADNAYFKRAGQWSFETGGIAYYTKKMPFVENPKWQTRTLLQIPFGIEISPSENIMLQIHSDLIAEWPYKTGRPVHHSMGGNSPRFRTKIRLMEEKTHLPAVALTVGVKFSSAKPFNIWEEKHNFQESNGLAGPGTGVADYLLLLLFSKSLSEKFTFHARAGLAPLGDPTTVDSAISMRGASQADEIPYGLTLEKALSERWTAKIEIAGMWGILRSTTLDHYSVFRTKITRHFQNFHLTLNGEKGLTEETNDWVGGFYLKIDFGPE